MRRILPVLLALASVAALAGTREVELATIKTQRVDPEEIRWGAQTEVGETTYGLYPDGTLTMWVGTDDGPRMVQDPDALRVMRVKRLEPDAYFIYPEQPSDQSTPILQTGDNVFSLWNHVSGGTTNYTGKVGQTGLSRTLCVQSLTDRTRIVRVDWKIEDRFSVDGNITNWCAKTHGRDLQENRVAATHRLDFSSNYINMNDNPPGCTVYDIVVYGYDGELTRSEIDASILDITVFEQDGRSYKLGRVHRMIEEIHRVQDRWAHYPAQADVNLAGNRLYFAGDRFVWMQDDGALGAKITSDAGDILSVDRGNTAGGELIKDFRPNTNGTVSIFVTTRFGDTFKVSASATVDGTFSQVAYTLAGTMTRNGVRCHELVCAELAGATAFYRVSAVVNDADMRGPSVTIHPDKIRFGSTGVELSLCTISNGTDTVSFLATGSIGMLAQSGGGGADLSEVSNIVRSANTEMLAQAPDAVAWSAQKAVISDLWMRVDNLEGADGSDVVTAAEAEAIIDDRISPLEARIATWGRTSGAMPIQTTDSTETVLTASNTALALDLSPITETRLSRSSGGTINLGIASVSGVGINPCVLVLASGFTSVSFPSGATVKGSYSTASKNIFRVYRLGDGLIFEKLAP